jgi:CheY-like chemotaxis protein
MTTVPACPFPQLTASWPQVGPWRVVRFLGSGGMGSVFAVTGPASGEVALKLIDPTRTGPTRARMLAEARAAAAVQHPHLVRCLDVGEHLGHPYLVMDLVPGGDGDDLVRRHAGRVPREILLHIAQDAASGLAALHAAGIVHRDLKPSNLLFGADGRALVADFGLAHLDDGAPGVTRAGFTVGTPDYMPPEQARAEPLDGRADLYALGATLYHLATGRPPHQGATTWVVLGAVISEPFPDVLALRSDLGSGFGAVISKLGAKQKAERYADAGQLLDDLALVTAGRAPVHARYRSSVELLASAPPHDGPTVLLIDDDPLVRRIYSTALGNRGLVCIVASDGAMGLDLARRTAPSVAVVDLVLPDIEGVEVVRRLHASHPDLPIVVLSNAFAVNQLAAARAAGATRTLPKAATPPSRLADELFALLRRPAFVVEQPPSVAPAEALSAADAALARMQVLVRRLEGVSDESLLLVELAAAAHGFAAAAGAAGVVSAATLGAATETLVRELIAQPDRRSASSRRTLIQATTALRSQVIAPGRDPAGVRALAVDDDRMARTLLGAALDRVAIRHDTVGSPEEALARLAGGGYHLLLTDVVMDHLSGFQLAARVRAMPGCEHLPIIFVTGLDDFPAFFAAGEGTGTDLIAKPYLLIELGVKSLVLLATRRS